MMPSSTIDGPQHKGLQASGDGWMEIASWSTTQIRRVRMMGGRWADLYGTEKWGDGGPEREGPPPLLAFLHF